MSQASEAADLLQNGATYVARTYRSAQAESPPAFVHTRIFVQKHKDRAVGITTLDYDWAEMDPRQEAWIEDGMLRLMAEDYHLDIMLDSIERH